jgi:hypothetical protein
MGRRRCPVQRPAHQTVLHRDDVLTQSTIAWLSVRNRFRPDSHEGTVRLKVILSSVPLSFRIVSAGIEWAGRKGHPSSYGMLGGFASEGTPGAVFDQHLSGVLSKKTLARSADHVTAALPDEYRPAIASMAEARRLHLVITVAAEGAIGSSSSVFASLTAMLLSAAVSDGWPSTGHDVFALWSSVRR